LDRKALSAAFSELGVKLGDALLVHSSYKSLGPVDGGPRAVIDALVDAIGPQGTLIMPTFNFGFCRGESFDVRSTPSNMGALTEIARMMEGAVRVDHPIYSFAVIGARAVEARAIAEPSSYGRGSMFGKLRDWDGNIMVIGLTYNDSMTFFHHVEEMVGVDYRYMKSFTGTVTDAHDTSQTRTVTMNVRDIDNGIVTAVNPMGELLANMGIIRTRQIGAAKVRLMRAREVFDATREAMRLQPRLLYTVDPERAGAS
jgi:aminoglycoside 3-N-acetyltransferase